MAPRAERPDMAAYGVPSGPDGVLPWAWAEERLVRSRNYWVVTVDAAGRPHAMPVWGLWVPEDERFWFACAAQSRKARNLAANPHVVVAADDTVEVVSVEGVAEPASPRRDVAERYAAKYEPDGEKRDALADFVLANELYAVRPVRAFSVIERDDEFAARATRWVW
jgi:hypothetical protein